jgi:UDP-N-acetylmuramoyl-tripeptide--D-alanyl-D-alanine ligase
MRPPGPHQPGADGLGDAGLADRAGDGAAAGGRAVAGGEAGVACAKAEVFEGLEPGGIAILNADNRWFPLLKAEADRAGVHVQTFGTAVGCNARLERVELQGGGSRILGDVLGVEVNFPMLQAGEHWGLNSMAVLLALQAMDVDLITGLAALAEFQPLDGRGAEYEVGGFTLIDESYNANPISMAAAMKSLAARPARGRRIVALTDMLELGADALSFHAALAQQVDAAGVDLAFAAGPLMKSFWDALPPTRRGGYAETADALAPLVAQAVEPGDVVMVKGSNGSRAGAIAAALRAVGPAGTR